jgi:iron-sulfur cluster repair protein YtfE (RIC family)
MAKKTSAGVDATKLLKRDHTAVKTLFKEYESARAGGKKKQAIVDTIREELDVHAQIEEMIFYPAVADLRSKDAKRLVAEAKEEHAIVKRLVQELGQGSPGELPFEAKMKVLKELVLQHIKEEERQIFPEAEAKMSDPILKDLGQRLEAKKAELMGEGGLPEAEAFEIEEEYEGAQEVL